MRRLWCHGKCESVTEPFLAALHSAYTWQGDKTGRTLKQTLFSVVFFFYFFFGWERRCSFFFFFPRVSDAAGLLCQLVRSGGAYEIH